MAAIRLAVLLSALAAPACADPWTGTLFDRDVSLEVPPPFAPSPAYADGNERAAIIEFLPPGDTVEAWSEMLTLTAYGGGAAGMAPIDAVMGMAENLRQGYSDACPEGLGLMDLGSPAVPGAEAVFAAWLACDEVGSSGLSEAMVFLVMAAGTTVYTVQWAERGPAGDGPPAFDADLWLSRLDALMTVSL